MPEYNESNIVAELEDRIARAREQLNHAKYARTQMQPSLELERWVFDYIEEAVEILNGKKENKPRKGKDD